MIPVVGVTDAETHEPGIAEIELTPGNWTQFDNSYYFEGYLMLTFLTDQGVAAGMSVRLPAGFSVYQLADGYGWTLPRTITTTELPQEGMRAGFLQEARAHGELEK